MIRGMKHLMISGFVVALMGNVVCLGQPELVYSNFAYSVGNDVCLGQRVDFWLDLTNVGNEPTVGLTRMNVEITPTGYFADTVAILCNDSNYVPLNPGETGHFYCNGIVPTNLDPGSYWFAIWFPYYDDTQWYPGFPTDFRICGGPGACCSGSGICRSETEVDCVYNMGWSYEGEGTQCLGDLNGDGWDDSCSGAPPTEACCRADGSCVDIPASQCLSGGGWPRGTGSSCSDDPWPCQGTMGCCRWDGRGCVDRWDEQPCYDQGGYPYPGFLCSEISCTEHACCLPDGTCENLLPYDCIGWGHDGIPQDPDVMCSPGLCGPDCLGDLDGDGIIMISDLGRLVSLLGQAGPPYRIVEGDPLWDPSADMDGNGIIMISDLGQLISILGAAGPPYRAACP